MPMQQLVAAIASQTSLTGLDMSGLDDGAGLAADDIAAVLAPLKKLQKLDLPFGSSSTGSVAAFQVISALPELRELSMEHVEDTLHMALLHRCATQLEELSLSHTEVQAGTLAALVCKLGMREVCKNKLSIPPVNWRWVEEGDGYVGRCGSQM